MAFDCGSKSVMLEMIINGDENLNKSVAKLVKYLGGVVPRHNGVCVCAPVSLLPNYDL